MDSNTKFLAGQVAIVTGGGRGLGRAFALALAEAGAKVAVAARSADQVAATVSLIDAQGGRGRAFEVDVIDAKALRAMVRTVEAELGAVDLLVNNAGVGRPWGPVAEVDADDWWHCLEVNLRGPFLGCQAVLPGMIARRRGRIINVSSGAGNRAIPHMSAYVTSKAALTRLSETIAAEVAEYGIQVFAIEPGSVRTDLVEEGLTSPEGRQWFPGWLRQRFESGQTVTLEFAAALVVWLASGQADALTGRFIARGDDLASLVQHADTIQRDDLLTLRLGRLS